MKRALVLAIVCALGLGIAAFAAPLTGTWDMDICFGVDQATNGVLINEFDSNIGIDYLVGGWTFGMVMSLNTTGMDAIYFHALGSLGAFSFASLLDFCPMPPMFNQWDNGAAISLAGINIFALFSLQEMGSCQTPTSVCSGFSFGGWGEAGDFSVYVETQFGLLSTFATGGSSYNMKALGFDTFMAYNEAFFGGGLVAVDPACCQTGACCPLAFTGLEIHATYPFACFEMGTSLWFNCLVGFDHVCFYLTDIDLGTWFMIDELEICFTVQTKTVTTTFDLVLADTVCFIPYFSLIIDTANPNAIEGISFDAFLIEYSWNGVTFIAGHIFNLDDYYFRLSDAALKVGATDPGEPDEYFGITAEGDSCCGGLWSASLLNFFVSAANGGSTGIFDWYMTSGALEFGLASNLSITAGVQFSVNGLDEFCIGFDFSW
jgi:hypothetical protein